MPSTHTEVRVDGGALFCMEAGQRPRRRHRPAVGAVKTLASAFRQAGTLQDACHTDGHYRAGMSGAITAG